MEKQIPIDLPEPPKPRIETLVVKVIDRAELDTWIKSMTDQAATHGCIVQQIGVGNVFDERDKLEIELEVLEEKHEKLKKRLAKLATI